MAKDTKIKTYANPNRINDKTEHKTYVPQYQLHGIEPKPYRGGGIALTNGRETVIAKPSHINPRENIRPELRQQVNQPYAEIDTRISQIKNVMPNSGNNAEQLWQSIDNGIIDDLSNEPIDGQSVMIDNNDYVSDEALGYQSGPTAQDLKQSKYAGKVIIEQSNNKQQDIMSSTANNKNSNDLLAVLNELDPEAFLLIVSGVPICSGPKEEIEEQVRSFLFGDNEMCQGEPIPTEDIIVVKKAKIKVGAFLD